MNKGTHFIGQPMYGQLIFLLDKAKILKFSRENGGERYVKHFDAWQHLVIMLYAVIKRFDSLREITDSMFPEARIIFKGVGRHPKTGRKKGGVKVHANIHANESVPSDIKYTSAATNDSFMLRPSNYSCGDILAIDRAYIDYAKFEELTTRGVVYVTKMKKNLVYTVDSDTMHMTGNGLMEYRVQHVTFTKHVRDGEDIIHHARIITYVDIKKTKARLVSLLTNDMDMEAEDIVEIYRKRWEIELLFKQLKQNFPLRYFYGESANAIKIQIWVTLIANLLLMVMQKRIKRPWSFSGLATMYRIMLMYYVNPYSFFEAPEKDWQKLLKEAETSPPKQTLFD